MPRQQLARLFSAEIYGLRDMQGRFARMGPILHDAQRRELQHTARKLRDLMREEAPVKTGYLRKHIIYRTERTGANTVMRVISGAPYTQWVIRGRGPVHAIRAKALHFWIDGQEFFRKSVGPAKANPFQARALARMGNEPTDTARRISRRVVSALAFR